MPIERPCQACPAAATHFVLVDLQDLATFLWSYYCRQHAPAGAVEIQAGTDQGISNANSSERFDR